MTINQDENRIGKMISAGIRSISASFPVFASFAQLWNEYREVKFESRIREWFSLVKEELERLENNVHALTDATAPMLERTIEKVHREVSQEKRSTYARFFARYLKSNPVLSADDGVNIVETLDTLTTCDLWVLNLIRPGVAKQVESFIGPLSVEVNRSKEDALGLLVRSLNKLESRGLITETDQVPQAFTAFNSNLNSHEQWTNRWRWKTFELLPFGEEFLKYTQSDA